MANPDSQNFYMLFLFHEKLLSSSSSLWLVSFLPVWGPGPKGKVLLRFGDISLCLASDLSIYFLNWKWSNI